MAFTEPPALLVAGLGRCGTSLLMQMLDAAGVPCVGEFPDYEVPELNHAEPPLAWLEVQRGKAMKVLNPHLTRIPPEFEAPVIWLDRNSREQAKSQIKFAASMMGDLLVTQSHVSRWHHSLREERREALAALGDRPRLIIRFEQLIQEPFLISCHIAAFLGPWRVAVGWRRPLRPHELAGAVRPRRSAACAPDLAMELALVAEAEARGRRKG